MRFVVKNLNGRIWFLDKNLSNKELHSLKLIFTTYYDLYGDTRYKFRPLIINDLNNVNKDDIIEKETVTRIIDRLRTMSI